MEADDGKKLAEQHGHWTGKSGLTFSAVEASRLMSMRANSVLMIVNRCVVNWSQPTSILYVEYWKRPESQFSCCDTEVQIGCVVMIAQRFNW